jgi:hypothetical protein
MTQQDAPHKNKKKSIDLIYSNPGSKRMLFLLGAGTCSE